VSSYSELYALCLELYDATREEYEYISGSDISEESLDVFRERKNAFRVSIENKMKNIVLEDEDKKELKGIFERTYELELIIGGIYKEKTEEIRQQIFSINKEKRLQEAYAKSGMNFGADNSLKDKNKI
jgi:hypothetical protein